MEIVAKYMKKADKTKNRVIIPKFIIDKFGKEFYMTIYTDGTIKLEPLKNKF